MPHARFTAEVAGRAAREALALGEGEVCARFQRSVYLRLPGGRYACVGNLSLGAGPLNALVRDFVPPELGATVLVSLEKAVAWSAPHAPPRTGSFIVTLLREAAAGLLPEDGLGCLIAGKHNPLSVHAQPALETLDRWLVGNSLGEEAAMLIGLGPGLTPSGDDYFGGMLVALQAAGRGMQARALWRWLEPRLPERTSAISAAHLAAAAAGEGHEALHRVLNELLSPHTHRLRDDLKALDAVGHTSGWDALAGAVAAIKTS